MPPAAQYRERLLVSPAPVVRPTLGQQGHLQHVELFPPRPEGVTADMRTAFRCFLHVMVFGADRLGRPVGGIVCWPRAFCRMP